MTKSHELRYVRWLTPSIPGLSQAAAAGLEIGVAPIELIGKGLSTRSLISTCDLTIRSGNIDSIVCQNEKSNHSRFQAYHEDNRGKGLDQAWIESAPSHGD